MRFPDDDHQQPGQSREFGFVNFEHHADAVKAVEEMHNFEYMGRTLFCCRAQKKAERSAELKRQYEIKRRERINKYQGLNVYVKYLEDHITEDKLRKEFEPFGTVENVKIMTNDKGQSKGFGFVCFSTQEEANRAVAEIGRNTVLPGCTKPIYVAIHQPREQRQQRFTNRSRNKGVTNIPQPGGMYPPQTGPVYYTGGMYPPRMVPPPGTNWPQGQYPPNPINPNAYVMPQVQNQPPAGTGGKNKGARNQPNQGYGNAPRGKKVVDEQAAAAEIQERHKIGERIYNAIAEKENQEIARRITGMLIYDPKWSNGDLYSFIEEDDKLDEVVREAKMFLENQQQAPPVVGDQTN
jgi:polyadenylate-binding protein